MLSFLRWTRVAWGQYLRSEAIGQRSARRRPRGSVFYEGRRARLWIQALAALIADFAAAPVPGSVRPGSPAAAAREPEDRPRLSGRPTRSVPAAPRTDARATRVPSRAALI